LGNTGSQYQTYYNSRCNIDSPVQIDLDITYGTTIDVSADITSEPTFSARNLKLRVALVELAYDITGGGWTYTHCEHAMLDMAPNTNGINFDINPGQTVTLNASFPIPTYPPTGQDNLAVIAFVQNDNTLEVLNACKAGIPVNYPSLAMTEYTMTDTLVGNGNGIAEEGETCQLWMVLENGEMFAPATGINGILSCDDPDIIISDNQAVFPDIIGGSSGSNITEPFVFEVPDNYQARFVEFTLDVSCNGGTYNFNYDFSFIVGTPTNLIVDDDGNVSYETHYIQDFINLGLAYDIWDVSAQGSPTYEDLANYANVVWFTSMQVIPLYQTEQDAIAEYLDNGGNLFISSENLGDNLGTTTWFQDYMHCQHGINHVSTTAVSGESGDPISNGQNFNIIGGAYWADNQSSLIPDEEAVHIHHYYNTNQDKAALRFHGDYNLVFFAFPYECIIPEPTGLQTPRAQVLLSIFNWFEDNPVIPGGVDNKVISSPLTFEVVSVFPNPFNPQVNISLAIPQSGNVEARVFNLLGKEVATVHNGWMNAGYNNLTFDGSNLPTGIYILQAECGENISAVKLMLMK
jgi:hypothetical protein